MRKSIILIFLSLLSSSTFAQNHLTVFYFGASNCPPCNRPEVVKSVNKLKAKFGSENPGFETKFVMVVFDDDINQGLKFIQKYKHWDEVSIGSRYHNELSLANLNETNIPGIPHILVYKETFKDIGHGIQKIKDKKLVREVLGGNKIVSWVNSGMELK